MIFSTGTQEETSRHEMFLTMFNILEEELEDKRYDTESCTSPCIDKEEIMKTLSSARTTPNHPCAHQHGPSGMSKNTIYIAHNREAVCCRKRPHDDEGNSTSGRLSKKCRAEKAPPQATTNQLLPIPEEKVSIPSSPLTERELVTENLRCA